MTVTASFGNLLENGSFDMQLGNGKFELWDIRPAPDAEGVTSIGKLVADSECGFPKGGNAVKFVYSGPGTYQVVAKGPLAMEPGQKYRLTVHTKSSGEPVAVSTEVRLFAAGQSERTRTVYLNFNTGPEWKGEWQEMTVEWTAAPNESGLQLVFYLKKTSQSESTVWLDEISIEPI